MFGIAKHNYFVYRIDVQINAMDWNWAQICGPYIQTRHKKIDLQKDL